jgi:hypothetical protein
LTGVTTTLKLQKSTTNLLTGSYVGSAQIVDTASPFVALDGSTQVIYINTDQANYKTTIGVQLGYQGQKQFQVSTLGAYVETFSDDCLIKLGGTFYVSCDNSPIYADMYFNKTVYYFEGETFEYDGTYAGYHTSGQLLNASICVKTVDTQYFCTVKNQEFYSADSVYSDNWNAYSTASAGTFGMGIYSPVWSIIGAQDSSSDKKYDIYMTNFNSWTWADPSYVRSTDHSVMNFGFWDTTYTSSMNSLTTKPNSSGGYLIDLLSFGFGKTDKTAQSAFYEDIMNYDNVETGTYGLFSNTTSLALNFRGLGLPTAQFNKFVNLLAVATNGEATCGAFKGGYCALSNPCAYYNDKGLWDFDFKVEFGVTTDGNYIRVPLATFAANYDAEGGVCVIFVEYLNVDENDSKSIILGGMFFQSFYAQYDMYGISGVGINLFVN